MGASFALHALARGSELNLAFGPNSHDRDREETKKLLVSYHIHSKEGQLPFSPINFFGNEATRRRRNNCMLYGIMFILQWQNSTHKPSDFVFVQSYISLHPASVQHTRH
jgi:hypothetical protein